LKQQKLFSGPIFASINPGGDLIVQMGYLLLNNLCALFRYYASALVVDNPKIGRRRLQMASFAICSILFILSGFFVGIDSDDYTKLIMALYFLSSFFGNFGANSTTYIMAAETYPTELRGTCHGYVLVYFPSLQTIAGKNVNVLYFVSRFCA